MSESDTNTTSPAFDAEDSFDSSQARPVAPQQSQAPAPKRPPYRPTYVHPTRPHVTQGTIDDDTRDAFENNGTYAHDSNFTARGASPIAGRQYRRGRADMDRLRRDSQYSQYLQVPKGKRAIFSSREQARRRKSTIAVIAIVALILIVLIIAVSLINGSL